LVVGDGAEARFEVRDASGARVKVVTWREDRFPVRSDDLGRHREERVRLAVLNQQDEARARRLLGALPVPGHGPHFQNMFVDDLGHVWLERPALHPFAPNTWTIFSPDGVWLGELELPEDTRPLVAGQNHLVVSHRGALDVETVRVYGLRRE
jgi:streptogramin lyase